MNTGTKLKVLREKKRISQEELANMVGVSQTTIGNWEHGKSIKHEYIAKLAEALSVPTEYLLTEPQLNNTPPAIAPVEKENLSSSFEFIIKAPNTFFEDLNRKIDFLVNKFNQNP